MKVRASHTLVVVMVLLVSCGTTVSGPELAPSQSHPPQESQVDVLLEPAGDNNVTALERRIKDLESRLEILENESFGGQVIKDGRLTKAEWTAQEAIRIVRNKIYERFQACHQGNPERDPECWKGDPVLEVFWREFAGMPNILKPYARDRYLRNGKWSAVFDPSSRRWQVKFFTSEGPSQFEFYAHEKTGLVEAVAP